MAKKSRISKVFGTTSRILMLVVAGLLILSYVSIFINPAHMWFLTISGLTFIPLLLVNVFLLLWAIKRRSKSFLIPLIAILPSLFFVGQYLQFSSDREGFPEESVKILSYNVGRFASDDSAELREDVIDFINSQKPDIICLQEFSLPIKMSVKSFFRKHFKGYRLEYFVYSTNKNHFGNVTLSRFPIKDKGAVKFDNSTNMALYTDIKLKDRVVRVYNCHFQSYNISLTGIIKSILGEERGDVINETGDKMKRSISLRPRQVDQVLRHIEKSSYPSFVCGDFNDNPISYTYYSLTKDRKDAFLEAGNGFGATYAYLWPMLRIDYILFPEEFECWGYDCVRVDFSDHYPIVATIEI